MRTPEEILQTSLAHFKETLSQHQVLEYQLEKFTDTTAKDVKVDILQIQHAREQDKSLMNLARLESFIHAYEQFDDVCQAMELENPELSSFIWGPPRFILQQVSNNPVALDSVLDSYLKFGRRVPLLGTYRSLLRDHDAMRRCLAYMYSDLLDFHIHVLKLFAQKNWTRTFSIYWRDYQEPFVKLLEGFDLHAKYLDRLAKDQEKQHAQDTSSQLTDHFMRYQDDREDFRRFLYGYEDDRATLIRLAAQQVEERKEEQYSKVQRWLSNPGEDEQTYHKRCRSTREEFPGTGSWILKDPQVVEWVDKEEPANSILWVYGKKGAGKTILASKIIDHLLEEKTNSTTSFFYCREDDLNESGKCMSLYKSLLHQIVDHNRDLLPVYYEKKLKGQEILNNEETARSLLQLCFEVDTTHFIVIDGLDEFSAGDRSNAVQFISSIVDKSDLKSPTTGKIRVLFISQDLKEMRKLASAVATLEIQPSHVEPDIQVLVDRQTEKLTAKHGLNVGHAERVAWMHGLSVEEAERVRAMTVKGANGMMLFAVLVMKNLLAMDDVRHVLRELQGPIFPRNLSQAYGRVLERLKADYHGDESSWEKAKTIFGWLACAKRPLKWHELQAAMSITVDERGNTSFSYRMGKTAMEIQEMCGSLIQVLPGNRIEFIHQTAKRYIIENQSLDVRAIECDLAILCMNYLTLRCFRKGLKDREIHMAIQNNEYGFQDYAVSKWNEHLQSILDSTNSTLFSDPVKGLIYQWKISQTLRRFKDTYKTGLAIPDDEQTRLLLDPEVPRAECLAFQVYAFYPLLVEIWTHVHRHQKLPAKERNKISIKELGESIKDIRSKLEALASSASTNTSEQSNTDMSQVLTILYGAKLYKCDRVRCVYFHEGFDEKEPRDRHLPRHDRPFECPVEGCTLVPFGFSTNKDKEKHVKNYHSEELDLPPQFRRLGLEPPKDHAKFQCDLCDKAFTRLANLEGHKNSHLGRRPYACTTCGKAFARANDRRRHEKRHVRRVGVIS
ncbi:hypothetical protein GE09DRAFT_358884 [Coniochaeta sp. 2T2.1]|nr:hypothetical protein GE09DRAFT_358884 [Coniochaeta sp. 2T2.1]